MGTEDRLVRRARPHLEPLEGLLGVVSGREALGRRRVGVVATDRRLLIVWLRPEPPLTFEYDAIELQVRAGGSELWVTTQDASYGIAVGDRDRLALLVTLIDRRADRLALLRRGA